MAGGRCEGLSELPQAARAILEEARRGFLATLDRRGRPHVVPVCYAIRDPEIVVPVDAKPKRGPRLARLRNLEADPTATFVVDRWSEDWARLGWVMVRGTAAVEPAESVADLVARYPQYTDVAIEDHLIVLRPDDIAWWLWD